MQASPIHKQSCASDLASGTFYLPVSALPKRRGGLSSSFTVVGSQHNLDDPLEMLLLHLLPMDGMGVPSSAAAGASQWHLQLQGSVPAFFCPFPCPQPMSLHLPLLSNSLCTASGLRADSEHMLWAVIPAGFPSCAPEGAHHVVPPAKTQLALPCMLLALCWASWPL